MARESFSDPAIAQILAERFVAVKVDREEHPDVDASYLAAASAFTRELGWPLTVFATRRARVLRRHVLPAAAVPGVPAFVEVLAAVDEAWRDRRRHLDRHGGGGGGGPRRGIRRTARASCPTRPTSTTASPLLAEDEDRLHGGFGERPKFPVAPVLDSSRAPGADGRLSPSARCG